MVVSEIFKTVEVELSKYVDFLCHICAFEAKAENKQTIDQMLDAISAFAGEEGFCVTRREMTRCGDFLAIDLNPWAEKGCVFLAHTDTVHEIGAFGSDPVTRLENRIVAPGAIDCKGGISIALLAMKALQKNGYQKHLRLLLPRMRKFPTPWADRKNGIILRTTVRAFPAPSTVKPAKRTKW